MTILDALKLPQDFDENLKRILKKKGTAYIIGFGRITITRYRKEKSIIPQGYSIKSQSKTSKDFTRISYRPSASFKEAVE